MYVCTLQQYLLQELEVCHDVGNILDLWGVFNENQKQATKRREKKTSQKKREMFSCGIFKDDLFIGMTNDDHLANDQFDLISI